MTTDMIIASAFAGGMTLAFWLGRAYENVRHRPITVKDIITWREDEDRLYKERNFRAMEDSEK